MARSDAAFSGLIAFDARYWDKTCCLRFGSVLLDVEEDDFLRWRRMPRRTWSGGVVEADMGNRWVWGVIGTV